MYRTSPKLPKNHCFATVKYKSYQSLVKIFTEGKYQLNLFTIEMHWIQLFSWYKKLSYGSAHIQKVYNKGKTAFKILVCGGISSVYGQKYCFMATHERSPTMWFPKHIWRYTSPNENFEYGYPHSYVLLKFLLKLKRCKPHKAARHPTCDIINNVKQFLTVFRRIYCRKFLTLSNQTSSYKSKCIGMYY